MATLISRSTDTEVGAFIDRVRSRRLPPMALVELLSERHPIYEQRSAGRAGRILGYAMASFEQAGLPAAALPHLLDALDSSREAFVVAGAARGLRGDQEPNPELVGYLLQAIENIRYHDNSVCLDELLPEWPASNVTSAAFELATTFAWLRGHARSAIPELQRFCTETTDFSPATRRAFQDAVWMIESDRRALSLQCCELPGARHKGVGNVNRKYPCLHDIQHLELENERGQTGTVGSFLLGKPTVVGFFYTRCMNPRKCSLTISKLGRLQRMLKAQRLSQQVHIAVVTYDPANDTPDRIDSFCANRGLILAGDAAGYRVRPDHFEIFRDFFELGVNYAGSVVNQHRLELFLIDHHGRVDASYLRLQWEVEAVLDDLRSLAQGAMRPSLASELKGNANGAISVGLSLFVAVLPKCPMCWAAYLGALGFVGLKAMPYMPWVFPLAVAGIAVNLFLLYRLALVRNRLLPFCTTFSGTFFLLPGFYWQISSLLYLGIALVASGALLNSLSSRVFLRLCRPLDSVRQSVESTMRSLLVTRVFRSVLSLKL